MTVRVLWLGWCAVVLGVLLVLLGLPPPQAPDSPTPGPDPAGLALPAPPLPAQVAEADLQLLAATPMWGPRAARPASAEAAASAAQPEPVWQLSGTYLAQGQRRAVLSYDKRDRPSQSLNVGDRLPDGSQILRIEADRVQLQDGKGRRAQVRWVAINRGLTLPQ